VVKRKIQKYAAVSAEKIADFKAARQKHSVIHGSDRIYLSDLSDLMRALYK
jgi:hypothetical protein